MDISEISDEALLQDVKEDGFTAPSAREELIRRGWTASRLRRTIGK